MRVALITAALLATTSALPRIAPERLNSADGSGKNKPNALPAVAGGLGAAALAGWALFERWQRVKVEGALKDHIKQVNAQFEEQERAYNIDVFQARVLGRTEGWFELESEIEDYYCNMESVSQQLLSVHAKPPGMTDEQFIRFLGEACRMMVGIGPPLTDRWLVLPRRREEPDQNLQQNTNLQFQDVGKSISSAWQSFRNSHMPTLPNIKAPKLPV